ncbi:MAG: flotillin-like FloA family protein [Planctomycetota bacterium]
MVWIPLAIIAVVVAVLIAIPHVKRKHRAEKLGCPLSNLQLLGMSLRGVDINAVLDAKQRLKDEGIDASLKAIEVHYLATRDLAPVVEGMIEAKRRGVDLSWEKACAMHIAGRDIQADIEAAACPREIVTPEITGRTMDGGDVRVRLKLKLRFVPERAVGAGDEKFVVERVCAAAEADIARSESWEYLLQRQATFARRIFERGLDAGSAFKIEWVDVEEMEGEKAEE